MTRYGQSAKELLASLPVFASAAPDAVSRLAEHSVWSAVGAGGTLYREGERLAGLNVLVSGRMQLVSSKSRQNPETVTGVRALSEASVFLGRPAEVQATALTHCGILRIPEETLVKAVEAEPGLARAMIGALSSRVHELTREIRRRERPQARERLVAYLLQQAGAAEGAATFTLHTRKATLAAKLRITPEHLSRLLRELRQTGLLRVDHQRISVTDVKRLAAVAQGDDCPPTEAVQP